MILTSTLSPGSLTGLGAALGAKGVGLRARSLLRFTQPEDREPLDRALAELTRFRHIVLTSPRAAEVFRERMGWSDRVPSADAPEVCAQGPATALAAGLSGVAHVPPAGTGAGPLANLILDGGEPGPALYLGGEEHSDELPARLRAGGYQVWEVACYRAQLEGEAEAREAGLGTDLLLIGSHRVLTLVAQSLRPAERPPLLVLGPATARTALALGWVPAMVARRPTVRGVVEAIDAGEWGIAV